ncbi:aspartate aminotransferase [Vibrio ishigakensis]|uniref:cysteine-S-conjugate beta-lyase n=1 Tax=Vibrio ishigakensis TaxID=1481914 RepID=A0A0B8QIJ8_9VIBR|nr:aspartate aminotransferase [Vibrio ishigakensis]
MFKIEAKQKESQNNFIKHEANMLNNIYGATDLDSYWIADMDFPIAQPITDELQRLVSRELYSYEFDSKRAFSAIADWNMRRHALELNPENFVQVPGVLSAIGLLIRQYTEKGDGVLIQTPVYHQFRRLIESAGRKVVANPLKADGERYEIDFVDFEAKLASGKAKMVLLCNPHNPVGRVWSHAEMEKLVSIAKKYDVVVVSDEVHADIVFDKQKFTSILEFDYPNIISIIGSPAKNFGLNSISVGFIYTNNSEMKSEIADMVSSLALDHGNALTTYATVAAYEKGEEWFDGYLEYTNANRDFIVDYLKTHAPQVKVYEPQGTNQIWFDFTELDLEAEQLKSLLVEKAKLALTPGTWFGESDPNFYRMNFAVPRKKLEASLQHLVTAINNKPCRASAKDSEVSKGCFC